jgi:hypothetical protein
MVGGIRLQAPRQLSVPQQCCSAYAPHTHKSCPCQVCWCGPGVQQRPSMGHNGWPPQASRPPCAVLCSYPFIIRGNAHTTMRQRQNWRREDPGLEAFGQCSCMEAAAAIVHREGDLPAGAAYAHVVQAVWQPPCSVSMQSPSPSILLLNRVSQVL